MRNFLTNQFGYYWDIDLLHEKMRSVGFGGLLLKYFLRFFGLSCILGIALMVPVIGLIGGGWDDKIDGFKQSVVTQIPSDLEGKLTTDGELITNQDEMWTIDYKEDGKSHPIVAVHPGKFSFEDKEAAAINIFSDAVSIDDDDRTESRVIAYEEILSDIGDEMDDDITFSHETFTEGLNYIQQKIQGNQWRIVLLALVGILFFIILGAFFVALFMSLGSLFIVFCVSILIRIVSKLFNPLTFGDSFGITGLLGVAVLVIDFMTGSSAFIAGTLLFIIGVGYILWMKNSEGTRLTDLSDSTSKPKKPTVKKTSIKKKKSEKKTKATKSKK